MPSGLAASRSAGSAPVSAARVSIGMPTCRAAIRTLAAKGEADEEKSRMLLLSDGGGKGRRWTRPIGNGRTGNLDPIAPRDQKRRRDWQFAP
ncbi:hypothetical protein Sa4125_13330 [Aureimonas sp. SA4125]|nr:hypothetical protein Sa4125_13330 [Aureimonas sp. SA4125]